MSSIGLDQSDFLSDQSFRTAIRVLNFLHLDSVEGI